MWFEEVVLNWFGMENNWVDQCVCLYVPTCMCAVVGTLIWNNKWIGKSRAVGYKNVSPIHKLLDGTPNWASRGIVKECLESDSKSEPFPTQSTQLLTSRKESPRGCGRRREESREVDRSAEYYGWNVLILRGDEWTSGHIKEAAME